MPNLNTHETHERSVCLLVCMFAYSFIHHFHVVASIYCITGISEVSEGTGGGSGLSRGK